MSVRDLIIVGAGPSGLSAAIAAKQRDLDYQVLEQGVLVNSIYRFPPQMVFFTTPELLEIGGLPFVSPYEKPTRAEALIYYRKVVDKYDLQISFDETVLSVEREGDPTINRRTRGARRAVAEEALRSPRALRIVPGVCARDADVARRPPRPARAPRRAGHRLLRPSGPARRPGEDLPHVHHYYGEPHPYYRQRVVIVGGGNSAAEAALEMLPRGGPRDAGAPLVRAEVHASSTG